MTGGVINTEYQKMARYFKVKYNVKLGENI
jgi:hypothetical protein